MSLGEATDAHVYQYCLRVAYLVHLCQPKPVAPPATASPRKEQWTTTLFSIGDVFGKSTTSAKLPKELPKLFNARLEAIAKGVDAFQDPDFRAIIGAFYGSYNNASFQRQLKENRKVEELILTFVTCAQGVLKKRFNGTDEWKEALMLHVGTFVSLIRQVMLSKDIPSRHVSKELVDRIDSYLSRLGTPHKRTDSASTVITSSAAADDMQLVKLVGSLFAIPSDHVSKDVNGMKRICTEKSALRDLKTCIANVNTGARYPGRREDFDSDESHQAWRKNELDTLQQLILALATVNRDALSSDHTKPSTPSARPSSMAFSSSASQSALGNGLPSSTSMLSTSTASTSGDWTHIRTPSLTHRPSHNSTTFDYFAESLSVQESDEAETLSIQQDDSKSFLDPAASPAANFDFTYIPPDPRSCYAALLHRCLAVDLDALKDLPPDEEVSLKILSKQHQALLSECAIRWRLSTLTRNILFVAEIVRGFIADEIPVVECVDEAILELETAVSQTDLGWDSLMLSDRSVLASALFDMYELILQRFLALLQVPSLDARDEIVGLQRTLSLIAFHPVFREDVMPTVEYSSKLDVLSQGVEEAAVKGYQVIRIDVLYKEKDGQSYVRAMREVLKWFRGVMATIDKLFAEPVLQSVDVTALYIRSVSPLIAEDIAAAQDIVPALLEDVPGATDEDAIQREEDVQHLFDAAREHVEMFESFCPNERLRFDFRMFEPLVVKWLSATSQKTIDWVNAAVSVDKFLPEGEDHHSSSIVDLIESCNSAVDHLLSLKWPDEAVGALFMTRLSQSVAKAMEEYCDQLEKLFMVEMFPPTINQKTGMADPETDERTSAWLVRAKGLVNSDKKVEPFSFREETLVKLNNIQAARDMLDKMYTRIDVDNVSAVAASILPPPPSTTDPNARNLFTIKVVLGEDLVGLDDTQKLNPFLTLSDSTGRRIAKTRTLYNSHNPRWGEVFDVSVQGSLWLASTIYHRNLLENHDLISRGYIHLNPAKYNDFLQRELWINQSAPQQDHNGVARKRGRCLFRISMEGEQDDIRFYFGRCFRSLKRTEADMVRIVVDRMSPMIRTSMSRNVLKGLLKKGGFLASLPSNISLPSNLNMDAMTKQFNDKINLEKFKALFSQSDRSEIPPLPAEVLSAPSPIPGEKKKRPGLNDADIEDAIGTLFEYFEETFALLKETLNDTAFRIVMSKIWKEILTVIEGLLVPPLSDLPSDMKPLNDKEVYIVVRWLKGLSNFFFAGGEGVPIEDLHNARFRQLLALPLFYELATDDLMMECNRALNSLLAATTLPTPSQGGMRRSKSVFQQRNLGTIRQRKTLKHKAGHPSPNDLSEASPDMMMRILRMRPNTQEFLTQQLETLHRIQQEDASKAQPLLQPAPSTLSRRPLGKEKRFSRRGMPPLPS